MDLRNEPKAITVMKKPVPVKVEFATEDGVMQTKEGPVRYEKGQAILTGVQGERWPMPRERLEATYNIVDKEKGMDQKTNASSRNSD